MRLHSTERPWICNRLLRKRGSLLRVLLTCCVIATWAGCASVTPPAAPITPAEQVQRDQAVGAGLANQLESQFKFRQDKEVSVYLRELATKLSDGTPELQPSAVGVLVVTDRGARWRNYCIPGNRIYLSTGLLRHVEFENELAAAIAMEFAHTLKRHVPRRMEEGRVSEQASTPRIFLRSRDWFRLFGRDGEGLRFFQPNGRFRLSGRVFH